MSTSASGIAVVVLALHAAPVAQSVQNRPLQADGIVRLLADLESALGGGRVQAFRTAAAPDLPEEDAGYLTRAEATRVRRQRDRARARTTARGTELRSHHRRARQSWPRRPSRDVAARRAPASQQRANATSSPASASSRRSTASFELELDRTRQFRVNNLTITAPDFTLKMSSGTAFVAESNDGITALVLRGRGEVNFSPSDPAEQGQMRLFNRRPSFVSPVEAAFVRVNPSSSTAACSRTA